MRRYLILLIALAFLSLGIWGLVSLKGKQQGRPLPTTAAEETHLSLPEIELILDSGDNKIKKEAVLPAKTPLDILENVTTSNSIELKTKQYDFGILVESIGGIANTKEKAWIYFVNGKAGEVASDKYNLKEGDVVEWKYIKPIY